MSSSKKIEQLKKELGQCKLLAVSKTYPVEKILEAYHIGQRLFGENRVQELCEKQPRLPADVEWHQIGSLQTNKVKYIAPFVSLIHSVESQKLLVEINRQAERNNRTINCLLQMHIAVEETKQGLDKRELEELLNSTEYSGMKNIQICGLMGMATNTDNQEQVRKEFSGLCQLFNELKGSHFANQPRFTELSMGMSSDYKIAIEEGSTMVRIGSAVFAD